MRIAHLLALAVAGGVGAAAVARAASFAQLISFGDSLSDTGNVSNATLGFSPGSNYFNGRFSNGPLWVEALAGSLSVAAPTPSRTDGLNYAHGGTKTGLGSTTFVFFSFPNVGTQVNQYLQSNTPTSAQLFTVYGGANDFLNNLGQNPTTVVNNLVAHVTALNNAGARHILVPNLPLLGLTPRYNANPTNRDAYNNLTAAFNAQLASAMDALDAQLPAKIYDFDVAAAFSDILANPAQFGLTNVTQPALVNGTVVANPDQYLFYDDVHPTRVGHRLLGAAAFDVVSTHDWAGGSGNWATSANWDAPGVPTGDWIASIDNRATIPFRIDVTADSTVRRVGVAGTTAAATVRVAPGATLTASESFAVKAGATLLLDGETARAGGPRVVVFSGGRVAGTGSILGALENAGTVSPGGPDGLGVLNVGADFAQSGTGVLHVELGAGTTSDRLEIGGTAELAGTLRLFAAAGQTPLPGSAYEVISFSTGSTGSLAIENHTGFAGLRFAAVTAGGGLSVVLSAFPGDANLDAAVNIADFSLLAANFNQPGNWLAGNFNGDAGVDIADFAALAANFNLSAPADPGARGAAVPEPATGTIGTILLVAAARRRYRPQRRVKAG